ncbi:MAG: riboflavin biosynthesis protein RibF, partial [Actinomycetota bacterium]
LAAHSVGTNDSVQEVPRLVESHVIGRDDLDLYDKVVTVEYVKRVRPWAKFASLEDLVAQIAKDVAMAKELMANE